MFKENVDFIRELYPDRGVIPLHEPVFIGNEKKYWYFRKARDTLPLDWPGWKHFL